MNAQEFTTDMIIQYSIVGAILLGACIWIGWKVFRKNRKTQNSCCGCALSDSCDKKIKNRKSKS